MITTARECSSAEAYQAAREFRDAGYTSLASWWQRKAALFFRAECEEAGRPQ